MNNCSLESMYGFNMKSTRITVQFVVLCVLLVHDRVKYWTAGVLAYFDALGQDAAPNDAAHPIRTRELLQQYDPDLFALVHETMAYGGKVDWRYRPYRR